MRKEKRTESKERGEKRKDSRRLSLKMPKFIT